jgi:exonuclease VII large subunit
VSAQLAQLSPVKILDRGYAIVTSPQGIVKDAAAVGEGTALRIRVARGEFPAVARTP